MSVNDTNLIMYAKIMNGIPKYFGIIVPIYTLLGLYSIWFHKEFSLLKYLDIPLFLGFLLIIIREILYTHELRRIIKGRKERNYLLVYSILIIIYYGIMLLYMSLLNIEPLWSRNVNFFTKITLINGAQFEIGFLALLFGLLWFTLVNDLTTRLLKRSKIKEYIKPLFTIIKPSYPPVIDVDQRLPEDLKDMLKKQPVLWIPLLLIYFLVFLVFPAILIFSLI